MGARIILAGASSAVGQTTLTVGPLAAFRWRGFDVYPIAHGASSGEVQ